MLRKFNLRLHFFAKALLNFLRRVQSDLFSQFLCCGRGCVRLMSFLFDFGFCIFGIQFFMVGFKIQWNQIGIIFSMKSGAFLKDIRNIKKGTQQHIPVTTKNIFSSKDLKKSRSSEQLNLHKFMDNKNQTIKHIDHKLQVHQSEIQKNNGIISELTSNFTNLRGQLVKEKQKSDGEEKKNRVLKEEIERTNKLLKNKNFKIEDLNKKISQTEKQLQTLRVLPSKVEELVKVNINLRKMVTHFEDVANEKKLYIQEKERQNEQLRDKLRQQVNVWEERQQFKNRAVQKEQQISKLKEHLTASQSEKMNLFIQKQKRDKQYNRLKREENENWKNVAEKEEMIKGLKRGMDELELKIYNIEKQKKDLEQKVKEKAGTEEIMKNQLHHLINQVQQLNLTLRTKTYEEKEAHRKNINQQQTILQLKKKLTETQFTLTHLKESSNKIQLLKKKSKTLQTMYNSIIPQIQCPFGHQLVNPITVIPCGHNYCLSCKRGYTKECTQCNGKLKIEAVYRNELMDDIIGIVGGIKQVVEILK